MSPIKIYVTYVLLLLGAFTSGVCAATDPLSNANRLPLSLELKVQDFSNALEASGYELMRGYWSLWSAEDCKYPLQTLGFCYGNNPTAPYVMAFVPHWKDEFVDQSMHHVLAAGQRNMTPNYRLGEREALVVLVELPPPARYFGMQTNVFTGIDTLNTSDPVYQLLSSSPALADLRRIIFSASPNPDRMMFVASIGNSINNVLIEEQSKESWGQQRFFVITPDQEMAEAMTDKLAALEGGDIRQVFTEPVSPSLAILGYGAEADDFITYIRYSMPNDIVLGEQWREQLPLTILRVRDPNDTTANKPFEIPEYEPKEANFDEHALETDLSNLVAAVKEYWGDQSVVPVEFRSLSHWVDLIGQHCLGSDGPPDPIEGITLPRGPMNCLGDSQDADYQISGDVFYLDDDEVIAVVGTLGTETGNATYTSISVNWFPELVGVLNRDDVVLQGSAVKFKDALAIPSTYKNFYVYYFARDCSGLYPWCQEVSRTMVPRGDTVKIIQRNYINPGSMRGPDPSKVLNPFSITFYGRPKM
ncbi:hypothetical protein [Desulfosediminicola flagellatus]|uniref:hypothetical protein n=1 Tax=Desulfosediminicola flagellatus TaxID=2569541 RepID=UPI0010AB6358|nr:hypothetical protein [Desulfosediminicola flagellatus]